MSFLTETLLGVAGLLVGLGESSDQKNLNEYVKDLDTNKPFIVVNSIHDLSDGIGKIHYTVDVKILDKLGRIIYEGKGKKDIIQLKGNGNIFVQKNKYNDIEVSIPGIFQSHVTSNWFSYTLDRLGWIFTRKTISYSDGKEIAVIKKFGKNSVVVFDDYRLVPHIVACMMVYELSHVSDEYTYTGE